MRSATHWHTSTIDGKQILWIDGNERTEPCVASIVDPERDAEAVRLVDYDTLTTKPIDPDDDPSPPRGLICYGHSKWDRPSFSEFARRARSRSHDEYFGRYAYLVATIDNA